MIGPDRAAARPPPPPSPTFPFQVHGEIARGGMGVIYRAVHLGSGQPCALKMVLAGATATEEQQHRFRREIRAQQEIDHPNVVRIHHVGTVEGATYFSMDLVEGSDLAAAWSELRLDDRVRVLAQVARAVHAAHEKGFVHRDLKPANILIDQHGQPRVTDFGLAKAIDSSTHLTKTGAMVGTPYYMSPEQATGEQGIGPPTDVFSLGIILFELVTGELPFSGTGLELFGEIVSRPTPRFAEIESGTGERGGQPEALERVILQATNKNPGARYGSALLLAEDLERYLRGDPVLAAAPGLSTWIFRNRVPLLSVMLLLVAGLSVGVGWLVWSKALDRRVAGLETRAATKAERNAALKALQRVLRTSPSPTALDAALDTAVGALGSSPPERQAKRLRRAYLHRAVMAWTAATASEARRLVHCAEAILADSRAPAAAQADALTWLGLAHTRLGDVPAAAQARERLSALVPGSPALALLDGAAASASGDDAHAIEHLVAAESDPGLTQLAATLRAEAFVRLAQQDPEQADAAKAAYELAERAPTPRFPAGPGRRGDALLASGDLEQAADVYGDAGQHERYAACMFALGREFEAHKRLSKAGPAAEVHALRATLRLGGDTRDARTTDAPVTAKAVAAALAAALERLQALAPSSASAALALADLRAASGDDDPYKDVPGADALAARARWLAQAGKRDATLAALNTLGDPNTDAIRDVPPRPALARRIRDAGWARFALGDLNAAAAAAEIARRGLPADLDTLALLGCADPTRKSALGDEHREVWRLDGAFSRGLLVARNAVWLGSKPLAARAKAMLLGRLAGDPSLLPLWEHLALTQRTLDEPPVRPLRARWQRSPGRR